MGLGEGRSRRSPLRMTLDVRLKRLWPVQIGGIFLALGNVTRLHTGCIGM